MTDNTGQHLVKVLILNKEYLIKSGDEAQVRRVAAYLNDQFDGYKKGSPNLNQIDLMAMVAFKAASDYFQARQDLERLELKTETDLADLAAKIEDGLARTGNPGRPGTEA